MSTPRFVDIHVLQPVPFANLNRDDLGSPKTVVYGGVERTRVSSQSWKRAVRTVVEEELNDPAVRTRMLAAEVAKELTARGVDPKVAEEGGRQVIAAAGLKTDNGNSSVLLFLPRAAIAEFTNLALANETHLAAQVGKKKPETVLPTDKVMEILQTRSAAVNLFGRMLAEIPQTEVDGAVQVAHAFTVHATSVEVDFFTAVDDLNPPDARGSGHMNSGQFAAGVFYRYACVAVDDLLRNLGGDTNSAKQITIAFLTAFVSTLPSGKKTATAPNTVPELVHLAVRADRPISLAGAFETPVRMDAAGGFAAPARRALGQYADTINNLWDSGGSLLRAYAGVDKVDGLGEAYPSYQRLIAAAVTAGFSEDTP